MVIHPENPINQVDIKKFERKHTSHTIMTVDLNEIKGTYALSTDNDGPQPTDENV